MSRERVIHGFPGLEKPAGVDDRYPSIYRGIIEDVSDPQQRKRVRVRVPTVHPDELDAAHLPWAEIGCMTASQLAGDFFPLHLGDRVWVQFEGGDRRLPVVTGSWIARPAALNDVPSDVTVDYSRTQSRWVRVDRVGNSLEMSELANEAWVRLVSGAAEVVLDQKDGSITLRAASSTVRQEAANIEADADAYFVTAKQIILSAETKDLLGASGILQLMSNYEANLHALDPATGTGVVRMGGYLPRYKGAAAPATAGMAFRQTPLVEIRSRDVVVGTPSGDTLSGGPVPETASVQVNGVEVLISAAAAVNKPSMGTVRIHITAEGDVVIESTSKVSVEAPEVDVVATTKASVQAPDVEIQGDQINLSSTTSINMT